MRHWLQATLEHRDLVILCPTAFEARVIRRSARLPRAQVMVTGPGADAVQRAVLRVRDRVERALLAGLAGGLDPSVLAGAAYAVTHVSSPEGRSIRARWTVAGLPEARLVSSPTVVSSTAEKLALGKRSGASLVDLEGFAFAEAASGEKLRWGIIRAVGDAHDQELPPGLDTLISPSGRTRHLRAALWILTGQSRLGEVSAIVGQSLAGLELLGRAIREALVDQERGRR